MTQGKRPGADIRRAAHNLSALPRTVKSNACLAPLLFGQLPKPVAHTGTAAGARGVPSCFGGHCLGAPLRLVTGRN